MEQVGVKYFAQGHNDGLSQIVASGVQTNNLLVTNLFAYFQKGAFYGSLKEQFP